MYYLINNNSDMSLTQQIARCDIFANIADAQRWANALKAKTGDNWEVIQIINVYTPQTLDEAHMEALDIPHMARD